MLLDTKDVTILEISVIRFVVVRSVFAERPLR